MIKHKTNTKPDKNFKPIPIFNGKETAAILNQIRVENEYSLTRLQRLTGYTKGHLSYVLSGKRGMSLEFLIVVLDALKYDVIFKKRKERNNV